LGVRLVSSVSWAVTTPFTVEPFGAPAVVVGTGFAGGTLTYVHASPESRPWSPSLSSNWSRYVRPGVSVSLRDPSAPPSVKLPGWPVTGFAVHRTSAK